MKGDFENPLPGVPHVESPFFDEIFGNASLPSEWVRIATDLRHNGFAIFDFPDTEFERRAARIKTNLYERFDWPQWRSRGYAAGEGLRIQDAWQFDDNVKALATNEAVLGLLSAIYGRRAWPFQTLNFPVGTQQHFHTDAVHFSSIPERFMCGVWVALEDINAESGPLIYYPGSHRWPIYAHEHIGTDFATVWQRLIEIHDVPPRCLEAKKGQALIWAANLLHGGSRQRDARRTRWSQVTHYYFDNCCYYTPLLSDPFAGKIFFRDMVDISTGRRMPNAYCGRPVSDDFINLVRNGFSGGVPKDFDPVAYLEANPDVAAAGADARAHYVAFGFREGRKLRR
jgi:hypothetical protein